MDSQSAGPIALFGAALDTGNFGVSALSMATLHNLDLRLPTHQVHLFDHGTGVRTTKVQVAQRSIGVVQHGAWISRRLYREESLWTMHAASRAVPRLNRNVRLLQQSRAVLDISGGDSFSDIYGQKQLDLVRLPKAIALNIGRPLLLLPQSYGPFRSARNASLAKGILARAAQAWARDSEGFERLEALLGDEFDRDRHLLGVDVAFGLPASQTTAHLAGITTWLSEQPSTIGINVSGLLFNNSQIARERFGLSVDYPRAMTMLIRNILAETDQSVLLLPHVYGTGSESDLKASRSLLASVSGHFSRLRIAEGMKGPDEAKYLISGLEWFLGARMHSCIAALSSRVPASAVAYSDKFRGVFSGCGLGGRVHDARKCTTDSLVDGLLSDLESAADDRQVLQARIPAIESAAQRQFDRIASCVRDRHASIL